MHSLGPAWTYLFIIAWSVTATPAQSQATPDYGDVAPILSERCVMCHSGDSAAAGLKLDSHDALLRGSSRGLVVKPGAPADSELIRRIKGTSQPRMPMTGPPFLSDAEIALVERWVAGGASKGGSTGTGTSGSAAPPLPKPGEDVTYRHVAPIFATRCAKCHSDNGLMGAAPEGYRLNAYADTLSTRDRARVVPGNPEASELLRRVLGQARPRMPLDGPPYLKEQEIRLIADWIRQGARNAEGKPAEYPIGATVRLHGTLGAGNRLDGLELLGGPYTRMDKSPGPGSYVEVRGRLDTSGNVIAERIRRR